jgi:hypothetical protein
LDRRRRRVVHPQLDQRRALGLVELVLVDPQRADRPLDADDQWRKRALDGIVGGFGPQKVTDKGPQGARVDVVELPDDETDALFTAGPAEVALPVR